MSSLYGLLVTFYRRCNNWVDTVASPENGRINRAKLRGLARRWLIGTVAGLIALFKAILPSSAISNQAADASEWSIMSVLDVSGEG